MEAILPKQRVGFHLMDIFNANHRLTDQHKKLKLYYRTENAMKNTIILIHQQKELVGVPNQMYILSIDSKQPNSKFPNNCSYEETVSDTVHTSKRVHQVMSARRL